MSGSDQPNTPSPFPEYARNLPLEPEFLSLFYRDFTGGISEVAPLLFSPHFYRAARGEGRPAVSYCTSQYW
jgi:hypothetical protein